MTATESEARDLVIDKPGIGWAHALTTKCKLCKAVAPCCAFKYPVFDTFDVCRPCWQACAGQAA